MKNTQSYWDLYVNDITPELKLTLWNMSLYCRTCYSFLLKVNRTSASDRIALRWNAMSAALVDLKHHEAWRVIAKRTGVRRRILCQLSVFTSGRLNYMSAKYATRPSGVLRNLSHIVASVPAKVFSSAANRWIVWMSWRHTWHIRSGTIRLSSVIFATNVSAIGLSFTNTCKIVAMKAKQANMRSFKLKTFKANLKASRFPGGQHATRTDIPLRFWIHSVVVTLQQLLSQTDVEVNQCIIVL